MRCIVILLLLAFAAPAAAQQSAQQRVEATIGALVTQNAAQAAQIETLQKMLADAQARVEKLEAQQKAPEPPAAPASPH